MSDKSCDTGGMSEPFASLHLEQSSTVDRVVAELRRAVFDGDLEGGTPLREVALAERLGVSRPTIREALTVLVAEGLAVREPNRGVSVARPDPDSVADVCRARTVLEVAGLRRWHEADDEARARVREALTAYTDAVAQDASYETLNARHLAVHASFVGLLGSDRLTAVADGLSAELRLALAQIERVRRNAHVQAGSHAQLVEMLERGEVEEAAAALEHHLTDAEAAIKEALRF